MSNWFWHDARIYVGNSTAIADNTFCGYASQEGRKSRLSLSVGDEEGMIEMLKLGESVKCPENIGTSLYVIVYL